MGALPFRGTSKDWRNGPTGTSWSPTKGSVKSCPWGGITPRRLGANRLESSCVENDLGSQQATSWLKASNVPLEQSRPPTFWAAIELPSGWRRWSSSSAHHLRHIGSSGSSGGLPGPKGTGTGWSKSSEGPFRRWRALGASHVQGEAGRAGTVQPGEETAQGDLINVCECLKAETDSSQQYPVTGREEVGTNGNTRNYVST